MRPGSLSPASPDPHHGHGWQFYSCFHSMPQCTPQLSYPRPWSDGQTATNWTIWEGGMWVGGHGGKERCGVWGTWNRDPKGT